MATPRPVTFPATRAVMHQCAAHSIGNAKAMAFVLWRVQDTMGAIHVQTKHGLPAIAPVLSAPRVSNDALRQFGTLQADCL